jgi:hypothetical protein
MKDQYHINIRNGAGWCRCKSVTFVGETAAWELSRTGGYEFLDAYKQTPHRQLIQATDDDSLRVFIKAWGPLTYPLNDWQGCDPVSDYRQTRDMLRAWVGLLSAVGRTENLREGTIEILRQEHEDLFPLNTTARHHLGILQDHLAPIDHTLQDRLRSLPAKELGAMCRKLLGLFPLSTDLSHSSLVLDKSRYGFKVKAAFTFDSLQNALYWMVWQDILQDHPFHFCADCRKLIQPDTRHEKKFCSPECAHRKTAREWQQRKREMERKANGT